MNILSHSTSNSFEQTGLDQSNERSLQKLFDCSPDALIGLDDAGHIVLANEKAHELFGVTSGGWRVQSIQSLLPDLDNIIGKNSIPIQKYMLIDAIKMNGERFWAEVALRNMETHNDISSVLSVRDVTTSYREKCLLEQKNTILETSNKKLEGMVRTDALTNLLNRRGLEIVLAREIEYAKRNKTDILVALIDLDDFKRINDSKGHANGDLVLKHVSQVLKDQLRAIDWIGRVGGDEFLVILPGTSLASGANVLERVRLALCQNPASSPWGDIRVTASIGLMGLPPSICTIEEVLELTQVTLKNSKLRGKNCVTFENDERVLRKTSSEESQDLRKLIEGSNGFRSITQRIVRLENEAVVAHEMLSRGPQGALEMPLEFFRVSQENNITTLVDLHCLKVCVEKARQLTDNLICHFNLFPSTLTDVKATNLLQFLKEAGDEKRFCIELSEKRMMVDSNDLNSVVKELKQNGVKIALDDVGFGYSSLEMLLLLEPDAIKLDPALVKGVSQDSQRQRMIKKLIAIATTIGATTIAEGVETREDYVVLRDIGVDYGQGWLWE